jgi:hypothetical protein
MLETGDIILVRGHMPIVSSAIRWFTNSEYTHVALVITEDLIYEIDIDKELAIRKNTYTDYDVFRYKNGLTLEQKNALQWHAMQRASENKGYDWLRILSFASQKLFRTKRTFQSMHRVICSEITDYLYSDIQIDLFSDKESGDVVPGQFAHNDQLIKVFRC